MRWGRPSTRRASWRAGWSRSISACASARRGQQGRGQRGQQGQQGNRASKASRASRASEGQQGQARQQGQQGQAVNKASRARGSTGPARTAGSAGQQGGQGGENAGQRTADGRGGVGDTYGGFQNGAAWGGGDRRPGNFNPEDIRQFRGEVRQWINDAEQLRRLVQGQRMDARQLEDVLRGLRQLQDDRIYQDVEELQRLQSAVTENMKRFEFGLRRRAEGGERAAGAVGIRRSTRAVPQAGRAVLQVALEGAREEVGLVMVRDRRSRAAAVALLTVAVATAATAQDFNWFRGRFRGPDPAYCPPPTASTATSTSAAACTTAIAARQAGRAGGRTIPAADVNFSIRLSELTKTRVSRTADNEPNHLVVRLTDDELFRCPFIEMEDVGTAQFSDEEVQRLREYLLKGGFLWVDDFWGDWAWSQWVEEIGRVLPPKRVPDSADRRRVTRCSARSSRCRDSRRSPRSRTGAAAAAGPPNAARRAPCRRCMPSAIRMIGSWC